MLVSWYFKPIQSQRIILRLRDFVKRYIVERTNKAEIDLKNRVRKQRVVERIMLKLKRSGHYSRLVLNEYDTQRPTLAFV